MHWVFQSQPDRIYAIRQDSPLLAAETAEGCLISSDLTAILEKTSTYYRPENGILTVLDRNEGIRFFDRSMRPVSSLLLRANWNAAQAQRGGFEHFMLKEIHEEPESVARSVRAYLKNGLPDFSEVHLSDRFLRSVTRIHMVACGSAMHAGLIGREMIEQLAGVPTEVSIASEFRYRSPIFRPNELVILISQSGETAYTLAALRYAKTKGIPMLAIVNVIGSAIAVEADHVIYTYAGPEIAVASTKAYMVQCALMYLFAAYLAQIHGKMEEESAIVYCRGLLPSADRRGSEHHPHHTSTKRRNPSLRGRPCPRGKSLLYRPLHGRGSLRRRVAQAQRNILHPQRGVAGRRIETRHHFSDDAGDADPCAAYRAGGLRKDRLRHSRSTGSASAGHGDCFRRSKPPHSNSLPTPNFAAKTPRTLLHVSGGNRHAAFGL